MYLIIFSFPAPIILAVLLNEVTHNKLKKVLQTTYYLPHFVSWVVVCSIIINFLSPSTGLFIWKEAGYGTIIYLAAITSIDQTLYEAAKVDGAGRLRSIIHITLPGIMNTVVVMLILRMGSILSSGFDRIYLLYSPLTFETSDVLDTFTYRIGIQNGMYSFSAAAGLFSSVVNFMLVVLTNTISQKVRGTSLW